MREGAALFAVMTAACYAPVPPSNVACSPNGSCPVGQQCFDGVCSETAPIHDARILTEKPDDHPLGAFTTPVLQPELSSPMNDMAPSLSADQRELFLSSDREGSLTLFVALRDSGLSSFETPVRVVTSDVGGQNETDPEISLDHLELLYITLGNQRNLRRMIRSAPSAGWAGPLPVAAGTIHDGPSLTVGDLRMLIATTTGIEEYQRTGTNASWTLVQPHTELDNHGHPGASADGLEVFATRGGRLFRATRTALDMPFGVPEPVSFGTDLDTFQVADPELSLDGRTLYLAINAGDGFDIYMATRAESPPL